MNSLNFQKIIVPVDFSKTSMCAVEHAALLARKTGAKLIFVHILESYPNPGLKFSFSMYNFPELEEKMEKLEQKRAQFEERQETFIRNELSKLEEKMLNKGITDVTSIIKKGVVYKKICSVAAKLKADLIVMGTHGASGFREFMVGSNTYKVVRDAVCPVISIKKDAAKTGFKNILLPFIDKPHMREHVDYALKLAKIYGATIHILGIDTAGEMGHFKKVRMEADQVKNAAEKRGIQYTSDVFPASFNNDVIMNYAKSKKADLIVIMADLDKVGILEYFTGPMVQQIVNHSVIPVLSIHPAYRADLIIADNRI